MRVFDFSKIDDCIEHLKTSPTFALSLCSKELAHSNMWACLMKKWPEFARFFFDGLSNEDLKRSDWEDCILREKSHTDIQVDLFTMVGKKRVSNRVFVIENKIKSTPTLDQLDKYQEALGDAFCGGVLTGVTAPSFDLKDSGWRFVSYKEIAGEISRLNGKYDDDPIIANYVDDLLAIDCLITGICKQNGDRFPLRKDLKKKADTVGLGDVCQKLLYSGFAKKLSEIVPAPAGYTLVSKEYFFQGGGGVDCRFEKNSGKSSETVIGIALEGYAFRRIMQKRDAGSSKNVYDSGVAAGWFAGEKSGKTITLPEDVERATGMQNDYCSYQTKEYSFAYQYWKIPANGLSFNELAAKIKCSLEYAVKVIEKHPTL